MLPTDSKTPWPPTTWQAIYSDYNLRAAWYAGDMNTLANLYLKFLKSPYNTTREDRFAEQTASQVRNYVHVPVASDIAAISANLLFGEAPEITCENEQAQARLDTIIADSQLINTLVEAADSASGMGGVCLKVNWDKALAPYPILSIAQADSSVPEWYNGILTACTFWTVLPGDSNSDEVWRLLERHEDGVILNGLYRGTRDTLGISVNLQARPETAALEPVIVTGVEGLLCRYIPNLRPNRKHRGSNTGRADTDGSESLMESLDEVYTSWIRDVRVGRGTRIVPEGFLSVDSSGNRYFDSTMETFVEMPGGSAGSGDMNSQITVSQFEIRSQQHYDTATDLLTRIISSAGYAPQSFGLRAGGGAEAAETLRLREQRSYATTAAKANYWKAPLEDLLEMLLLIDAKHLGGGPVDRPDVVMQDGVKESFAELATAVGMVNQAQAASVEWKVRKLNPDYSEEQVQAEVQRILDETGLAVPSPEQFGDQA